MTRTLTIAGLRWRHHGPSFYELEGFPCVEVAYLGEPAGPAAGQWFLFLADDDGSIRVRSFDRRDDACAMVAEAFTRAPT